MVEVIEDQRPHIKRAAIRSVYTEAIGTRYLEFLEIKAILAAQILISHTAFAASADNSLRRNALLRPRIR